MITFFYYFIIEYLMNEILQNSIVSSAREIIKIKEKMADGKYNIEKTTSVDGSELLRVVDVKGKHIFDIPDPRMLKHDIENIKVPHKRNRLMDLVNGREVNFDTKIGDTYIFSINKSRDMPAIFIRITPYFDKDVNDLTVANNVNMIMKRVMSHLYFKSKMYHTTLPIQNFDINNVEMTAFINSLENNAFNRFEEIAKDHKNSLASGMFSVELTVRMTNVAKTLLVNMKEFLVDLEKHTLLREEKMILLKNIIFQILMTFNLMRSEYGNIALNLDPEVLEIHYNVLNNPEISGIHNIRGVDFEMANLDHSVKFAYYYDAEIKGLVDNQKSVSNVDMLKRFFGKLSELYDKKDDFSKFIERNLEVKDDDVLDIIVGDDFFELLKKGGETKQGRIKRGGKKTSRISRVVKEEEFDLEEFKDAEKDKGLDVGESGSVSEKKTRNKKTKSNRSRRKKKKKKTRNIQKGEGLNGMEDMYRKMENPNEVGNILGMLSFDGNDNPMENLNSLGLLLEGKKKKKRKDNQTIFQEMGLKNGQQITPEQMAILQKNGNVGINTNNQQMTFQNGQQITPEQMEMIRRQGTMMNGLQGQMAMMNGLQQRQPDNMDMMNGLQGQMAMMNGLQQGQPDNMDMMNGLQGQMAMMNGLQQGQPNHMAMMNGMQGQMAMMNGLQQGQPDNMAMMNGLQGQMDMMNGMQGQMAMMNGLQQGQPDNMAMMNGLQGQMDMMNGMQGQMAMMNGLQQEQPDKMAMMNGIQGQFQMGGGEEHVSRKVSRDKHDPFDIKPQDTGESKGESSSSSSSPPPKYKSKKFVNPKKTYPKKDFPKKDFTQTTGQTDKPQGTPQDPTIIPMMINHFGQPIMPIYGNNGTFTPPGSFGQQGLAPPNMVRNYNINYFHPWQYQQAASVIYENSLPMRGAEHSFRSLGERYQMYQYVKQFLIKYEEGEEGCLYENKSGNALFRHLKLLDGIPVNLNHLTVDPFFGLSTRLRVFRACYPITSDESGKAVCQKGSTGIHIRLYRLNIDEYINREEEENNFRNSMVQRDLMFYRKIRRNLRDKVDYYNCPHVPIMYTYNYCPNSQIDFRSSTPLKIRKRKVMFSDYLGELENNCKPGRPCSNERLMTTQNPCMIVLTEAPTLNFYDWIRMEYTFDGNKRVISRQGWHDISTWSSVYFQIFYTMIYLEKIGIYINNFSYENIWIKNVKPGGHWRYIINGISYYVPNKGAVVMIDSNFKDIDEEEYKKRRKKIREARPTKYPGHVHHSHAHTHTLPGGTTATHSHPHTHPIVPDVGADTPPDEEIKKEVKKMINKIYFEEDVGDSVHKIPDDLYTNNIKRILSSDTFGKDMKNINIIQPPSNVKDVLDKSMVEYHKNSEAHYNDKDNRMEFWSDVIYATFNGMLHNRIGDELLHNEAKEYITHGRTYTRTDFTKGEIVALKTEGTYIWVLYVDDEDDNTARIIRDIGDDPINVSFINLKKNLNYKRLTQNESSSLQSNINESEIATYKIRF
jgi:hypothetical protein